MCSFCSCGIGSRSFKWLISLLLLLTAMASDADARSILRADDDLLLTGMCLIETKSIFCNGNYKEVPHSDDGGKPNCTISPPHMGLTCIKNFCRVNGTITLVEGEQEATGMLPDIAYLESGCRRALPSGMSVDAARAELISRLPENLRNVCSKRFDILCNRVPIDCPNLQK
ncbi:unnamed protein product, partial [Meganyctiphanes norvegica]